MTPRIVRAKPRCCANPACDDAHWDAIADHPAGCVLIANLGSTHNGNRREWLGDHWLIFDPCPLEHPQYRRRTDGRV